MHGLLCSNKMQKDKANNQDLMTMYQKDHHFHEEWKSFLSHTNIKPYVYDPPPPLC
jgi:hypothetical protein